MADVYRIHHVRPRFKNNVESVLLYMASEIVRIGSRPKDEFEIEIFNAIKRFPGNNNRVKKTIDNWRTEISSLFGLYVSDGEITRPGEMAKLLDKSEDLPMFFKYFLYNFQYPGGHLKPHETLKYIKAGIKFKPAKYILMTLLEGKKLVGELSSFGLSKAETTHLIFNSLAVTRDNRDPKKTAALIIQNRKNNKSYDERGDVIRYAGDILDYMVLADVLSEHYDGRFYIKPGNVQVISAFIDANFYFEPYEELYKNKNTISLADVKVTQNQWFEFVNNELYSDIFETDISTFFNIEPEDSNDFEEDQKLSNFINQMKGLMEGMSTKRIGDLGETISISHELNRLKALGRNNLLHLIKKIPEVFAVGYDISSYEGIGDLRRYIEVKTTISKKSLIKNSFHMTPSEWSAASSNRDIYYIYRLFLSVNEIKLFVIKDPVGKYKEDIITMIPRDGAHIEFTEASGVWEECLYD
jgi:hypothetical protein